MKKTIISSVICAVIFFFLGAGSLYLFNKNKSSKLEKGIVVEALEGKPGTIVIEKVKNYPKRIELTVHAKDKGTIRTIIKKVDFCPKIYKNSLSLIVYTGIVDLQPILSYGIMYKRQVFSRFHLLAGVKVDTNIYRVNGFQGFLGAGWNF